jgi:hypothetical protein
MRLAVEQSTGCFFAHSCEALATNVLWSNIIRDFCARGVDCSHLAMIPRVARFPLSPLFEKECNIFGGTLVA